MEDYCSNRPAGITRGVRSAFFRYFTWARLHKNDRSMIGNLEAWGKHLVAEGVKPASARVQMSRVSSVLRQFFKNENRLEQIEALRYVDKPEKQLGEGAHFWLIPEQSQALLKAPNAMTTKGIRVRVILACMLGAGILRRIGEHTWSSDKELVVDVDRIMHNSVVKMLGKFSYEVEFLILISFLTRKLRRIYKGFTAGYC